MGTNSNGAEAGESIIPVLEARGLTHSFGAIQVAKNIDFVLQSGGRHALIGPNGAGKTTFINLVTGRMRPSSGSIVLDGMEITLLPVHHRVKRGLARTFQLNTLLRSLTILENVQLAVLEHRGQGAYVRRGKPAQRAAAERAFELLRSLGLEKHAGRTVSALPYGHQRLVEIAIALALEPLVLLLDEPAAGVSPAESDLMYETIASLPRNIGVLIIEHDMKLVFRFAEKITVLVQGSVLKEGTPDQIASDEAVRDVYLGHRRRA